MKVLIEIFENFKMSFEAMVSSPLRSFLASLGVMVGISIVILMGWLLEGLDNSFQKTFEVIGADMIYVDKWDWTGGKSWKLLRNRKNLTLEQAIKLKEMHKSAELVIPNFNQWGMNIKYEDETVEGMSLVGAPSENQFTPAGELIQGRYYSEFEDNQGDYVTVIGYNVYKTLFPDGNAIGKIIKMNNRKYEVIGVVKKRGTFIFDFIDNQVFVPLNNFIKVYGTKVRSVNIGIKAGSKDKLDEVRTETIGLMRIIRNVKPGEENNFSINETKVFEDSIATIRNYIWVVGILLTMLSFIVGIIGIMNIMFVSVSERTKEIGIRKSMGAKKRSIWTQFLVESSSLTLFGAFASIIICTALINIARVLITMFAPDFADVVEFFPPYLSMDLMVIASVVSIILGVFAGLIPAVRASNLDPVMALRSD